MLWKNIKRVLAIILTLFILMWPIYNYLLQNQEAEQRDNESETAWKGIITIWDFPRLNIETGSRYGWIIDKIRAFEKKNPSTFIHISL